MQIVGIFKTHTVGRMNHRRKMSLFYMFCTLQEKLALGPRLVRKKTKRFEQITVLYVLESLG